MQKAQELLTTELHAMDLTRSSWFDGMNCQIFVQPEAIPEIKDYLHTNCTNDSFYSDSQHNRPHQRQQGPTITRWQLRAAAIDPLASTKHLFEYIGVAFVGIPSSQSN